MTHAPMPRSVRPDAARRLALRAASAAGTGWLALRLQPLAAQAVDPSTAGATLRRLVAQWAAGAPVTEARVTLDIPPLVENGNAVPVTVRVDSPMTADDHVQEIAVFNSLNPQQEVLRCRLSPANGRAEVALRLRLATSQPLVALARTSDGRCWSHQVQVLVTLAACVEG